MENNQEILNNLIKNLLPDQKIEIDSTGSIKIVWRDSTGKRKSQKAGNLFESASEIIPLKGKLWVTPINESGIKSWSNFGKKPTKDKKDYDSIVIIGIYLTAIQNNPHVDGNFTDSNSTKFKTKKFADFTGYYNQSDKLRFVEFMGKKYYNNENPPGLNTQYLDKKLVNI